MVVILECRSLNKTIKMEKIKNTYWFRRFLLCNRTATKFAWSRGWEVKNFAQLIVDEQNGRYGNSQMTVLFTNAQRVFAEISEDEPDIVFEMIQEEQDLEIEDLAKLTAEELDMYYEEYIIGKLTL